MNFLIYHSGFISTVTERAYDASGKSDGVDTLITSLHKHQIKPNSNVYAELGSTWRFLMRDPEQAAHALGKLIVACGESNVLWGTDSIWYGSPQDQIQAFRTFQISAELRERHGYPEITPTLRAKIFGLNAANVYGLTPTVPREARSALQDIWAEDAARVPQGLRSRWLSRGGAEEWALTRPVGNNAADVR